MSAPPVRTLVLYAYVPDILERRGPHRPAHLARLEEWREAGLLVAAGATGDPVSGAAFVFTVPADEAERMTADDPYVAAGLVTSVTALPWTVVVGSV